MAIAFFLMLGCGVYMEYFVTDKAFQFQLYQWHKAGGVLLLIATALRLLVRFFTKAPKLPKSFKGIELKTAKAGHYGLYLLMIAMVTSGWIMVSSSIYGLPTIVFNLFEWPHIPNLQGNNFMENTAKEIHFYGAILFGLMIVGHIGAVVKHIKVDKENLLTRMWWGLTPSQNTKKTLKTMLTAVFISLLTSPAVAKEYSINTSASILKFSGTHAGNEFKGTFNTWSGTINLEAGVIEASFDTASANTGNAMYDGTLPTVDWLNSKKYPKAIFKSETITKKDDKTYNVTGKLTIRNISQPLTFELHVDEKSDTTLKGNLSFTINRLDFDLGKKSDANAEWVSADIPVTLTFIAD